MPRKVGATLAVVVLVPCECVLTAGLTKLAVVAGLFLGCVEFPCHTYIIAKPVPKAGQLVLKDF